MIPANHDSRIEAQQLPRERFSPMADLGLLLRSQFDPLRRSVPTQRVQQTNPATGTVIETYQTSLNDFIGTQQQRLRNRQTERFGGLEIDDQIKFRGLLDGYVARICALEDSVDENCRMAHKA